MKDYSLSEIQSQAILDMKLQKLSGLEREKIRQEHKELQELIVKLKEILADEAASILEHTCTGIPKSVIHAPGPDYIERIVAHKNRKPAVLRNLNALYNHGRLASTGYMSLLPVDQGVEHSAGASFAPLSLVALLSLAFAAFLAMINPFL